MKKRWNGMVKGLSLGLVSAFAFTNSIAAFAVYSPEENGVGSENPIYNEFGAHAGLSADTENADISEIYSDEYAEAYVNAGAYIISDKPVTDKVYEPGIYYEMDSVEYGDGIYVIIQDENSPSKFYTFIKSTQDLEVGDKFIWRDGDVGGRLLDDKYTSTHMAGNYLESDYSYVSYDTSGGKLAAQEVTRNEDGSPAEEQAEGFTYLYLVSETPADYCQRMENEAAGYETAAQAEERSWMPVNNHNSDALPTNNWTNLTEDDDQQYNDKIARTGATEGNSNTRLYSYSGQNVIVAKFAIDITESTAKIAWAENTDFNENADYTTTEGEIELNVGETKTVYFHTQYTSTWGRDGYANSEITYTIGDESIISYVGKSEEEGQASYVLTGLKAGTTTLKATVNDSENKYSGGAEITLNITVK